MELHRSSCHPCHRRECATSPLRSEQWCHGWEYSENTHHTQLIWSVYFWPQSCILHSSSSPEIWLSCQLRHIYPQPSDGLSAIWRRAVWWLLLTGRPYGPSSGPCSQTDSGSQNAKWHTARRGHPLNWHIDYWLFLFENKLRHCWKQHNNDNIINP